MLEWGCHHLQLPQCGLAGPKWRRVGRSRAYSQNFDTTSHSETAETFYTHKPPLTTTLSRVARWALVLHLRLCHDDCESHRNHQLHRPHRAVPHPWARQSHTGSFKEFSFVLVSHNGRRKGERTRHGSTTARPLGASSGGSLRSTTGHPLGASSDGSLRSTTVRDRRAALRQTGEPVVEAKSSVLKAREK